MSFWAILPGHAQVDETPAAILVLDASGSMWGQIDGINKIVIAREVIGEMLQDLPASQALGLTVYGHRTRGDCADIETLIAPGLDTRDAIAEAVNTINPRGRTPMTASVAEAARALRHTENAATVILVSDGIETCEADPCAIAAELEASGIAFTAHVIGFDVADPAARAQMQCIADNTGGEFLTADNAEELAEALEQVAVAPPPVTAPITLRAVVAPDMSAPVSTLEWALFDADGAPVLTETQAPTVSADLLPGTYRARVLRMAQGTEHEASFTVEEGVDQVVTITLPFIPPPMVEVTFTARIGGEAGPMITDPVLWEIRPLPENVDETVEGNELTYDMATGAYTATAYWTVQEMEQSVDFVIVDQPREIAVVFPEPQLQASIIAPVEAVAGSTIEVGWTGPDEELDYIGIGPVDARPSELWRNYTYTRDGNPLDLLVPPEPGDYLIQYFRGENRESLAMAQITVTPVEVTLVAPETGIAGDTVEVGWTGPDYENDYIGIGRAEAEGGDAWENYTYTREGRPLALLMPTEPGDYLITYFMGQDRTPITSIPIELSDVQVAITAPAEAIAGATIEVGWTGPDYENDYIGIGPVGASGGDAWENYTYTRDGSPLELLVPSEPGAYMISYFLGQDRELLAQVPITLTEVQVSITAPGQAVAGSTIEVGWAGPDYADDYIGIGRAGSSGGDQWENYAYTRDGNPLQLLVPTEPGEYQITYFLNQDRAPQAFATLTVTPVTATLTAAEKAPAGGTIEIGWTGPDYQDDYIGIGRAGADGGGQWQTYAYTREGNPLTVSVPDEPGAYVIRYFMSQDRRDLVSRPLIVE
ncbi:vWA domain-containing protein [Rhodophyticola sp. CCM32]|uniref:vWA domain-containing protein n=1 Tax=Rhodophyticola sp. CCM32 TaxID=2916397 RepID=UPI00143DF90D|nr:VWA domain-containing protein [Rhodophyticola sp. CCM32]